MRTKPSTINRSVRAQENLVDASLQAAGSHSCTRIGNILALIADQRREFPQDRWFCPVHHSDRLGHRSGHPHTLLRSSRTSMYSSRNSLWHAIQRKTVAL